MDKHSRNDDASTKLLYEREHNAVSLQLRPLPQEDWAQHTQGTRGEDDEDGGDAQLQRIFFICVWSAGCWVVCFFPTVPMFLLAAFWLFPIFVCLGAAKCQFMSLLCGF